MPERSFFFPKLATQHSITGGGGFLHLGPRKANINNVPGATLCCGTMTSEGNRTEEEELLEGEDVSGEKSLTSDQ